MRRNRGRLRKQRGARQVRTATNRDVLAALWNETGTRAKDASRVKAALAVIASAAGAYVLGRVVIALRLDQAKFPVQDSLDVTPFPTILITGIRELVISALVAAFVIGVMLACTAPNWMPD